MKPNYSHSVGIASLNGILATPSHKSKPEEAGYIYRDWALKWSKNDNHMMIGKRVEALKEFGIEIPGDMKTFAEGMGIEF